jgi:hypothetical protein
MSRGLYDRQKAYYSKMRSHDPMDLFAMLTKKQCTSLFVDVCFGTQSFLIYRKIQ